MTTPTVPARRVPVPAVPLGHPDFPDLQAACSIIVMLVNHPEAPAAERAEWARAAAGWMLGVARREEGKVKS